MTDQQKQYAEEVIKEIKDKIANDKNFGDIKYNPESRTSIDFSVSLKQLPLYEYLKIPIKITNLPSKEELVAEFMNDWEKATAPENIDLFCSFIRSGEKYGWD